ncbi:MAG: hypothetical protein JWM11_6026 [Planctomycetaceae bacterium]|nr:hypothetical protein [Planctomycetaceae bacterium]
MSLIRPISPIYVMIRLRGQNRKLKICPADEILVLCRIGRDVGKIGRIAV